MSSKAEFNAIRSIAFGDISGTYANVGTATTDKVSLFKISNNTDGDMMISLDGGLTDHIFVAAGSFSLYDVRSNINPGKGDNYVLKIGTQFAVKQITAPTENSLYIEVMK